MHLATRAEKILDRPALAGGIHTCVGTTTVKSRACEQVILMIHACEDAWTPHLERGQVGRQVPGETLHLVGLEARLLADGTVIAGQPDRVDAARLAQRALDRVTRTAVDFSWRFCDLPQGWQQLEMLPCSLAPARQQRHYALEALRKGASAAHVFPRHVKVARHRDHDRSTAAAGYACMCPAFDKIVFEQSGDTPASARAMFASRPRRPGLRPGTPAAPRR